MLIPSLQIVKEALASVKANYKVLLKTMSWLFGVAILLIILNIVDRQTFFAYINYTFPIYLILTALSFVFGLWTQIVLMRLINASLTKEAIDNKTLQQNSWRDTVPFFWVSLLTGLIIFGGMILLIVPGLIFSVWYFFSIYAFGIDGVRGYSALQKSKDLVQGRFWPVVWRVIVANVFYGLVLVVLIGVPTLIIGYFVKFSGFNPTLSTGPWWYEALQSLMAIITLPLNAALWVILYKNLKDTPINKITPPTV